MSGFRLRELVSVASLVGTGTEMRNSLQYRRHRPDNESETVLSDYRRAGA